MKPLDPRLLRHARTTRTFLAVTVVLGAVHAVMIVGQAALLAYAISAVFLDGLALPDLTPTLAWLVVVTASRALLAWIQEVASARAAATVKSELRRALYARIAALGPGARLPGGTGAVTTLLTRGLDALDAYFARYLPQLVLAALVPAIVLVNLAGADLIATATISITLPLIPIFMALVGLHTEAANRRQFRLLSRLGHHFLDVIAGLPTLRLFGRARAQAQNIRRFSAEQRRLTMRTLRIAFLSSLVLELLATLSVALVAVGIGLRLVDGRLDLATALLVLILAPEAYLPLRQVGANYHASAEGLAAAEEAFAILEIPPPATGTGPAAAGPITFHDVTVTYPDRAEAALRITARVAPGEIIALTGPSGCGKSTALAVLLGFVAPTSGTVSVGGHPLTDMDMDDWRRRLAWVPQHPRIFAGTVRDNVTLGAPFSDAQVRAALRDAAFPIDADAVLCATEPGTRGTGLDTVLGDDGAGLSAGQRQRLALARAFLRDAPIVLLDEPTANLDVVTAAEVMAAVRRLAAGRTVLIVAHRPELIALADRVIDLAPNLVGAR